MLANASIASTAAGTLRPGLLRKDGILDRIIDFVAQHLTVWRDDPARSAQTAESRLNHSLALSLDEATRWADGLDSIKFSHEPRDDAAAGRALDIAAHAMTEMTVESRAYGRFDILLPIECKRLPTPNRSDRDPREYVLTQIPERPDHIGGGIQRFKRRRHGANHERVLMIGYVQRESHSHWLSQVNAWIDGFAAADSQWRERSRQACWQPERLRLLRRSADVARHRSRHRRDLPDLPDIAPVIIDHLWIAMPG